MSSENSQQPLAEGAAEKGFSGMIVNISEREKPRLPQFKLLKAFVRSRG